MPEWQYELYSPFNLMLLILKFAVPVLVIVGVLVAVAAPKGKRETVPTSRRVGVAEYLAMAAGAGAADHEVTGRLRVRRNGEAWLEATDKPDGDAPAPKLRLNPKTVVSILADIPDHGDTEFRIDTYAWFRGRPAVVDGETALSNIAEGSIYHHGQQYGFELLRG